MYKASVSALSDRFRMRMIPNQCHSERGSIAPLSLIRNLDRTHPHTSSLSLTRVSGWGYSGLWSRRFGSVYLEYFVYLEGHMRNAERPRGDCLEALMHFLRLK